MAQAGNIGFGVIGAGRWNFGFLSLLCFTPGWTFFNLAFSSYLQHQFFNWASVPGGRFSNPPTTPSPARCRQCQSTFIMIERYIPRIKRIIDKIHLASENPFEKKILWLEIQEELIKLITSVEYKIRKSKSQIQILKRELSTRDLRLSKIESQTKKDSIEYFKYKIESYSSLLILTRTFGDAIAHTFINRFDIKPQSFKETTGYLTNKKGSRLERKCLRGAFQKGGIAILNDLTNALRYFDLTLIKDKDIWFPFEMKSGKHKTDRDKRQEAGYEKLMDYLHLDKPADILKKDMLSTRVSMKREPKNHIQTLNKLINKALKDGFAHQQVEEGLFYLVRYFADIKTEKTNSVLNSLNLKKPIPFFINNIRCA
jgi:hypothetical protein